MPLSSTGQDSKDWAIAMHAQALDRKLLMHKAIRDWLGAPIANRRAARR
jgi:hypothetical protein